MRTEEPEIKQIPDIQVVGKKFQGVSTNNLSKLVGPAMGEIFGEIGKRENAGNGIHPVGPPMYIDLNTEFNPENMCFEIAVPVNKEPTINGNLEYHIIAGGKVVSMMCFGPYSDLSKDIYGQVFAFAKQKGLRISGPLRELYHNNPQEVSPENLQTELQLPVE
ncbi:MAG: hypothetical protein BAJATHORv1_50061 [Candidatus Thorarchaeota archaeon]|nr:MAG: hypothetical protein BAJATHORv1_50061 [Candidatus Thorarchaeota archaeon]